MFTTKEITQTHTVRLSAAVGYTTSRVVLSP